MKLPYTFHRLAAAELEAAEDFYEKRSAGAGLQFVSDLEAAVALLREFPESAPIVRGAIRGKVVHRYPFTIYFRLKAHQVRILAVAYQKRAPLYWLGRR